jgi:hypothetical protein
MSIVRNAKKFTSIKTETINGKCLIEKLDDYNVITNIYVKLNNNSTNLNYSFNINDEMIFETNLNLDLMLSHLEKRYIEHDLIKLNFITNEYPFFIDENKSYYLQFNSIDKENSELDIFINHMQINTNIPLNFKSKIFQLDKLIIDCIDNSFNLILKKSTNLILIKIISQDDIPNNAMMNNLHLDYYRYIIPYDSKYELPETNDYLFVLPPLFLEFIMQDNLTFKFENVNVNCVEVIMKSQLII